MSSREKFLDRVAEAARLGRHHRVHLNPVPAGIGYIGAGGDLCQRFAEEVNAVGGQAIVVDDLPSAAARLRELLVEAAARSALCWQHELLDRLQLGELLRSAGVEQLDHAHLSPLDQTQQRAEMFRCDVGITSCDLAIAETGTLVMSSASGHERTASLLPPMHIAIVERQQIVPDLIDAVDWLNRRGLENMPSNVTLITGPSKTGDIELQLTTGVHGPGKWRVIVIRA